MSFTLRIASLASVLVTAFFVAPGCGGQVSVGTDARPAPSPDAPSSTPPSSFTDAQIAAATQQCAAPHGPSDPYATLDELVQRLSGVWLYCGRGTQETALPSSQGNAWVGAELTTDGHFYWLATDASRGLARGQGIGGAAGYEIAPPNGAQYNNDSFQINVWYADRSVMPTRATFERAPTRLALEGIDGYFVPVTK